MDANTASTRRQERAQNIDVTDLRRINETVWEMDCINDNGDRRENITLIPSERYSPTKDMQHRGPKGIVGKYLRTLAMESDDARRQLRECIEDERAEIQAKVHRLKEEEANLLHSEGDLDSMK